MTLLLPGDIDADNVCYRQDDAALVSQFNR